MSRIKVDTEDTRVKKLADYLITYVNELLNVNASKINVNALSKDVNNYSLDKIPTNSEVETWITGLEIHKDVYSFRSRNEYSLDLINNLKNIGFFEKFENIIDSNNKKGVLPDIDGIESIECLNCGTMNVVNTNTAIFDIQIQIVYRANENEEVVSM